MVNDFLLFAQSAAPNMNSTFWISLTSRILHVLSAIILVGGLFYIRYILCPLPHSEVHGAGSADNDENANSFFGGRRAAWAMWVGIASGLLIATGLLNYLLMINLHERLHGKYHMIAGIKILLGIVLFFLAALLAGRSAAAQTLRRKFGFWLTTCLILGILTVALGSVLRTFPRALKVDAAPNSTLIAPK